MIHRDCLKMVWRKTFQFYQHIRIDTRMNKKKESKNLKDFEQQQQQPSQNRKKYARAIDFVCET